MNKTLSKAFLAVVFSLASLSASAEYTFTVLDGLVGSNYSSATSINNLGQIVGYSYNPGFNNSRATLWNNGVATDISPQGSVYSTANSINDFGQIVGQVNGLGTLWSNGVATDIILFGIAESINDSGQIVGYMNGRAALWENGGATDISQTDGYSYADSINNLGQIVGHINGRATLWNNGVATDIHPEGNDFSRATSINNSGQIVGFIYDYTDVIERAILWNNGVVTDITPQGGVISDAYSINDFGQIVGQVNGRATLWSNGVATDLNSFLSASNVSAGWRITNVSDINDNGDIIGYATNTVSGAGRPFLLQAVTPVPEADTSAMLLTGLGLIGFMARRRKQAAS